MGIFPAYFLTFSGLSQSQKNCNEEGEGKAIDIHRARYFPSEYDNSFFVIAKIINYAVDIVKFQEATSRNK